MILFFRTQSKSVIATEVNHALSDAEINKLCWLYGDATYLRNEQTLQGYYVGPRREMITPWSTNAVEITQNMSLDGILRIEEYFPVSSQSLSSVWRTWRSSTKKKVWHSHQRRWNISTRLRSRTVAHSPILKSSVSHRLTLNIAVIRFSEVSSSLMVR